MKYFTFTTFKFHVPAKAFSMKRIYLIVTKSLQFRPVFIAFVAMEPPGDRGSEVWEWLDPGVSSLGPPCLSALSSSHLFVCLSQDQLIRIVAKLEQICQSIIVWYTYTGCYCTGSKKCKMAQYCQISLGNEMWKLSKELQFQTLADQRVFGFCSLSNFDNNIWHLIIEMYFVEM